MPRITNNRQVENSVSMCSVLGYVNNWELMMKLARFEPRVMNNSSYPLDAIKQVLRFEGPEETLYNQLGIKKIHFSWNPKILGSNSRWQISRSCNFSIEPGFSVERNKMEVVAREPQRLFGVGPTTPSSTRWENQHGLFWRQKWSKLVDLL